MANDYLLPFRDQPGTPTPQFVAPPQPPAIGANATANFFWGQGNLGSPLHRASFNALHMVLIPKGAHQGKILVWGGWFPVRLKPNANLEPAGRDWFCQAWSIIDPLDSATRFRNYLLPLQAVPPSVVPPPPPSPQSDYTYEIADLFCTGHTFTAEGDLVVAGGAKTFVHNTIPPAPISPGGGARFLFLFDPSKASQAFEGQSATSPLYPSPELGHWQRQPDLLVDRFYPTVTLSQRLARNNGNEIVVIAGGSDGDDEPENTYETYVPGPLNIASGQSIFNDPDPNPPPGVPPLLEGPTTSGVDDLLDEYPRLHLLSDNRIFKSGPARLGSKVDQDVTASTTPSGLFLRPWNTNGTGRNQVTWQFQRHDGASLLLCQADLVSAFDILIRLGGGDKDVGALNAQSTDSAEFCIPSGTTFNWSPLGNSAGTMPGGPRQFPNAVVLPDGSIVVIGGADNATLTYTTTTVGVKLGFPWTNLGADTPTRRGYHSTAILLPDGRVFVGGGELLSPQLAGEHDYDIFVPHYLQGDPNRPTIGTLSTPLGVPLVRDSVTGAYDINAGSQFQVDCSDVTLVDKINHIVLMAPGSITHHSDMNARYVKLAGTRLSASRLQVQVPNNGSVPRGFYMMFALTNSGIPTVAEWIKVL